MPAAVKLAIAESGIRLPALKRLPGRAGSPHYPVHDELQPSVGHSGGAVIRTGTAGKTVHRAGYGWERAGEITSAEPWQAYLSDTAEKTK